MLNDKNLKKIDAFEKEMDQTKPDPFSGVKTTSKIVGVNVVFTTEIKEFLEKDHFVFDETCFNKRIYEIDRFRWMNIFIYQDKIILIVKPISYTWQVNRFYFVYTYNKDLSNEEIFIKSYEKMV